MYVCLCNAISDKKMTAVITDDTRHVGDVFRSCGHRPQCGKCLKSVAEIIEQTRATRASGKAAMKIAAQ